MRIMLNGNNFFKKSWIGKIVLGMIFLFMGMSTLSISLFGSFFDKYLPDEVVEYDAYIVEVKNIESETVRKRDEDGYSYTETMYTCDVVFKYEIDGVTYTTGYSLKDYSEPAQLGDKFGLYIDPAKPEKIYGYSRVSDENVLKIVSYVFTGIGSLFIVLGVIFTVKGILAARKQKKLKTEENNYGRVEYEYPVNNQGYNQGYNSNYNMNGNYNNQGYNNQDYNNQAYNNQGYNNQAYNNYNGQNYNLNNNMGNNYGVGEAGGTDYSGTSLRD